MTQCPTFVVLPPLNRTGTRKSTPERKSIVAGFLITSILLVTAAYMLYVIINDDMGIVPDDQLD